MRAIRWAASSLNELCINGLHEAATMTGWLLAPVTPRSSANKPNQVVVGAAHTRTHTRCAHTLRTHTLFMQYLAVCLWAASAGLFLLTDKQQLLPGFVDNGSACWRARCARPICQHTQKSLIANTHSRRWKSLSINIGNHTHTHTQVAEGSQLHAGSLLNAAVTRWIKRSR